MTVTLLSDNGRPVGYGVLDADKPLLEYNVGDTVEVMVQQKMGWKAVVLAYLLPFFVMLAVMFIGNAIWAVREEILGTVALCTMALYYLVLGMFKDRLQKEFSFTARKKNA